MLLRKSVIKHKFTTIFVLMFLQFLCGSFSIANAQQQEVYLVDKQLIEDLKSEYTKQGKSSEVSAPSDIVKILYEDNKLPLVDSKIASEKLKIEWMDNKHPINYPKVAICYIDDKVGYGLFALEQIDNKRIIAEYTGELIEIGKNGESFKENSYLAATGNPLITIDAKKQGNATRFANHFMDVETLDGFGYKMANNQRLTDVVATPNSSLICGCGISNPTLVTLAAIKQINAFEQIGYQYDKNPFTSEKPGYGYGFSTSPWHNDPALFNKKGGVVPVEQYTVDKSLVVLVDILSGNRVLVDESAAVFTDTIKAVKESQDMVMSSIVLSTQNKGIKGYNILIYDIDEYKCREEINLYLKKQKTRIVIYGYFFPGEMEEEDRNLVGEYLMNAINEQERIKLIKGIVKKYI